MILNRQRRVRISVPPLENFLGRLRRLLRLHDSVLTVCFVTNVQIARWNRAYRGHRGATDVLSFRSAPAGNHRTRPTLAGSRDYLGDIAIAPVVARRNAKRFGRSLDRELRVLILHGALHLLGYDHETDNGKMTRRELRLRRRLELM